MTARWSLAAATYTEPPTGGLTISHLDITRRAFLRTCVGLAGLTMPTFLQLRAEAAGMHRTPAKSCIIIYCWGGISQFESWDPKPDALANLNLGASSRLGVEDQKRDQFGQMASDLVTGGRRSVTPTTVTPRRTWRRASVSVGPYE